MHRVGRYSAFYQNRKVIINIIIDPATNPVTYNSNITGKIYCAIVAQMLRE